MAVQRVWKRKQKTQRRWDNSEAYRAAVSFNSVLSRFPAAYTREIFLGSCSFMPLTSYRSSSKWEPL